ncbi:CDP-diacylglycerol--glycerol-3-phosphate 3-phosphatidyltransferase [Oscillospiraceae bacterium 38-13]
MNLPNKLTMLRIILTPVFLAVLYWGFPGADYAALAIFIIASLTDLLDGKIARKYNLVTDFGKFADPLADKILVVAALLWFVERGRMSAWMLMIVITREFAVSGLRMIASDNGRVIAAGWSGKVKTASTMVCIVIMLLIGPAITAASVRYIVWIDTACVWIITLTTLYSGVEYFVKNKDVIRSA